MTYKIKTYSFDKAYLPISQYLTIDQAAGQIIAAQPEAIPYPVTDGNILDTVIRYYLTHHKIKTTRAVAKALGVSSRDLSSAIHLLTGMHHDDFMRQYRLRSIVELLTQTQISPLVIAKFFGYASLHLLNQFLTDQTGLTANELRAGASAEDKQKRKAWSEQ